MRTSDIAYDWRRIVIHPGPWTRCATQISQVGLSGGFEVESPTIPRRKAYLKPLKPGSYPTLGVAAREKLASDLAYDLDVPVPPVVLFQRGDAGAGEEVACCVSVISYPRQIHWGLLRHGRGDPMAPLLKENIDRHLPIAAAKALAFDTWVLQNDHDHDSNSAFGYDFREMSNRGFVFFDYAFAFAFTKVEDEITHYFEAFGEVNFPSAMRENLDKSILDKTISRIEEYPEDTIKELVTRIPTSFLDDDTKARLVAGLAHRRRKLRTILGAYL